MLRNLTDPCLTFLKEGGIEHLALKDISGQKNCIAAHLLIHFALHHFFIENEVSVPNFLVLDKFLQAFEESEKDQVIDFIFKRVQELDSKFQVIILEKEDLRNNSQYQNAIVPEWTVNRVLVPQDWYE